MVSLLSAVDEGDFVVRILFDKPLLHVIEHHAIVKRGLQYILAQEFAVDKGYAFLGFSDFHGFAPCHKVG